MDRRSRPGPEPTTLEAVGNQWRYALVVVQAGDDGDGDDDDDDALTLLVGQQERHLACTKPTPHFLCARCPFCRPANSVRALNGLERKCPSPK